MCGYLLLETEREPVRQQYITINLPTDVKMKLQLLVVSDTKELSTDPQLKPSPASTGEHMAKFHVDFVKKNVMGL